MAGTVAGGVTAVRISIFVSDTLPARMAFLEDLRVRSCATGAIVDGYGISVAGWVKITSTDRLSACVEWALAFVWCCRADGATSLRNALIFALFLWFGSCARAFALIDGLGIETALA